MNGNNEKTKKYIPARKCICCGKRTEKSFLTRIVIKNDEATADFTNTMDGRGAYICKSENCLLLMEKKGALGRAFKRKISSENYRKLLEELIKDIE